MRWLLAVLLVWGLPARAHDADVIYVMLKPGAQPEVVQETITLTAATLASLAPLDADGDQVLSQGDLDARARALQAGVWDDVPLQAGGRPCALFETGAWLREGFVELQGQFRCGEGELRQDFRILRVLPANYRVVLGSQLDGEGQGRGFAQGSLTTIPVPRPPPPGHWDRARFGRAFAAGVARGLSPEVLAGLFGVLLTLGAWRRGLRGSALVLAGVMVGSWAPLDWWTPTVLLLLVTGGAAVSRSIPGVLPGLLGLAIGAREGGGGWVSSLGLAAGTLSTLLFASPVAVAVGVWLQRRPRLLRGARWAPLVLAVAAVAVQARLSW